MITGMARHALLVGTLTATALGLTACSSSGTAASAGSPPGAASAAAQPTGAGATTTGTAPHGISAPSAGTGSDTNTGAGTGTTGVPACATSQLTTTAANFDSGAGHTRFQLVFENTGTAPCTLTGYPGVSFVQIHNYQLGKAASRIPGAIRIVTLIPHARAYAEVQSSNGSAGYASGQCQVTTVPTLRVFPPNQRESSNLPWNRQECVGSTVQNLEVAPVHGDR